MKRITAIFLCLTAALSLVLGGCGNDGDRGSSIKTAETIGGGSSKKETEEQDGTEAESDASASGEKSTESSGETETAAPTAAEETEIPELPEGVNTLTVTVLEGTAECWSFSGNTLTFSGLTEDTVVSVSGEFDGQITVDAGDGYKFELELCGAALWSSSESPITVLSGDKFTLSAKKDTENYIYDTREAVTASDDDSDTHSAAVFSKCDMDIEGKGALTVVSEENNGIHTKDDLNVKNLSLTVNCIDNPLKGNDSVTIESGSLTLISRAGDGVKTSNTDISDKGKQRGTVSVLGGSVTVYAACDGIDAAYNAEVSGEAVLNIFTDSYSPYSGSVETTKEGTDENVRYIRFNLNSYSFSVKYYNSDDDYVWVNAEYYKSVSGGRSTYYYYTIDKLTDYDQVQFFIYEEGQEQGQEEEYAAASDYMSWNTAYDTFALEASQRGVSYNWTNYTTSVESRGMSGMSDGNSNKSDYSTKGIKAGNEILVTGGTVYVEAYDDALHANSESSLENGETPTGNVSISGGSLTLSSKDDGIHADGVLTVSGGTVSVTESYEGLEGSTITISGGDISVVSSDDGMNSTATSGTGITFTDGTVYIYAGGDGVDANSRTQYTGVVFNGGTVKIVSTTSMNSSIDTEGGYTYNGGSVLALCPTGGMTNEVTSCKNFSSVGTKCSLSLSSGDTVTVKDGKNELLTLTMPCSMNAFAAYLGSKSADISAD